MPANRNALIRYKTIDQCLRNRQRLWTLDDLIEACSDALDEFEGIKKGISKRTVQGDIQTMRSEKLGYNAPIIVKDKKYYIYEDPAYSITNIPVSEHDMTILNDALMVLQQFNGFSHFEDMSEVVHKLQHKIDSHDKTNRPIIDFEKNELLKGIKHLDALYQHIRKENSLFMTYQSFKADQPTSYSFCPYLLKEYNNRWFLLGKKRDNNGIAVAALDRIISFDIDGQTFEYDDSFDPETYFKDIVGVTNSNSELMELRIKVHKSSMPYILTKPIHPSQKIEKKTKKGMTIVLHVKPNFELESMICSYAETLEVLAPESFRKRIKNKLKKAAKSY